jgi:hypothetical protein
VDLNPLGFTSSYAYGVAADRQAGYGIAPAGDYHALVWSGTASSAVDLQSFLPPTYNYSEALAIADNGNVFGFATYIPTGESHAILWVEVPEPSETALLVGGGLALTVRRRKR